MVRGSVLTSVLLAFLCKTRLKNAKLLVQLVLLSPQLAIVLLNALVILKLMATTKFATINASMQLIIYMPIILQVCVSQLALQMFPFSQILSVETVFFSVRMDILHKILLGLVLKLVWSDLQII